MCRKLPLLQKKALNATKCGYVFLTTTTKKLKKESNIAAFVSFEHLTFVEWNSIFVTAITASTGREFPISSFWISAHSRNNSNGNSFVFVINICESLTSAERVRAPVLQQHLSYLQDARFHWKRLLLINYECEKRNKKQYISKAVLFSFTHLSLCHLLLVDLPDLGAVGQQVA